MKALSESELLISLGKQNYAQHFEGLDEPQSLVEGIDAELADVLQ